jgi:hypothetical protein
MREIVILFFVLIQTAAFSQKKKYEVSKIDKNALETMNVIYLKKKSFSGNRLYRIITSKSDTLIADKKEIVVGDNLFLKLIHPENELDIKDGYFEKPVKNSFFYKDTYNGKSVNIDYYCPDFIGLYHLGNK